MEQIHKFPANYFSHLYSPAKMFHNRNALSWWNIIIVFLFLTACLVAPVSLSFARMDSLPLSRIAPNLNEAVNNQYNGEPAAISIQNGMLEANRPVTIKNKQTLLAINPGQPVSISGDRYHKKVKGFENALILQKKQLTLADQNGFGFTVQYPRQQEKQVIRNADDLAAWAAALWYQQYQVILIPLLSGLAFVLLGLSNLILMGACAFILWLTRFSGFSGIRSLKQAVSIVLFAAGIPSIAAMLAGFARTDPAGFMMIQSLGMVLIIALIFFKTKFQPEDMPVRKHKECQ
ncbi:DUF1189 family protein [Heyndrickxia acidiproducens]|uniref:DUF1189 family protein n=1 Tax=Heyndrickxia acidiproducens TaxID=1121084 RepID=UPI000378F336|nr:DUF1189 family protein [Heyndrickxia acidiproducens]